jgi:type IV pilus assembly protein PilM
LGQTGTDEIVQTLKKEVAQRFGLNPDKDAMDYMVAGDVQQGDETKSELILFAADNETIKSHIQMLEEAGLRPVAIDTIPSALFRSFERSLRRQEDREHTIIFVDVGSRFTTVVFGRGGEISFIKQITIGGEKFNDEIATRLGIKNAEAQMLRDKLRMERGGHIPPSSSVAQASDDSSCRIDAATQQAIVDAITTTAEELAREISLCLRYYTVTFRGKRVERAIFTGGEAYENILLNILRRQLTVGVEVAQPLRGFDLSTEGARLNFDSDRRGLLCEWAVAVGLGLKGWNGAKPPSDK